MNDVSLDKVSARVASGHSPAVGDARFNAMGIPVDNLDIEEACDRIVDLVYRYPRDRTARYVATVNVDFMVNALDVGRHQARHPELLEILRSADLVTADGFPIVLLSKLMGSPLRARVTGADLVPALAERAARDSLRLYLFGGREAIAKRAADLLIDRHPGLEVVGVESPMVHTEGDGLVNFEDDDERIIDNINRSGADILLIGLGNPKQEQWFRRHQDRLKVPVSIGIGGTFEFIAGSVKRAPESVQRANMEWLYRISQDPARLWRRYAEGLVKLGLLVTPALLLRARELLLTDLSHSRRAPSLRWTHFRGPNQASAASVRLPPVLTASLLRELLSQMRETPRRDTLFLLDFSSTRRVEVRAMQAMFELGRCIALGKLQGVHVGMRRRLRQQLAAWRILDLFDDEQVAAANLHRPLADQQVLRDVPLRFYASESALVVYLHGNIDGELLRRSGLESLLSLVSAQQRCVIDLRFTRLVESSAVAAFHRLASRFEPGRICFAGVNGGVRKMFELARVPQSLEILSDREEHQLMVAC